VKPYGRKTKIFNYVDNHPPKGFVNWWEVELCSYSKKTPRQNSRKHIKEETAQEEEGRYGRS
jgi:hypothetical protein